MIEMHQPYWRRKLPYITCYTLFAVVIAASIGVVFIWAETILALLAAFVGPTQATELIYAVSILAVGIPLFIWAMYAEPYLRTGAAQRQLWPRFLRVLLPPVAAGAAGLLLQAVAVWAVR